MIFNMNDETPVIKKYNRIKTKTGTKNKFWCGGCDANLGGEIGKCPQCGFINSPNKCKNFQLKD